MEIGVYIWNSNRREDADTEAGIFLDLPIDEEEVRERLGFDGRMEGYHVTTADHLICGEIEEDTSIQELNRLYEMLASLERKVHEDDVPFIKNQWFRSVKEMCDNIDFVEWIKLEDTPTAISEQLYADERYLVTSHGVYSFDEPVY